MPAGAGSRRPRCSSGPSRTAGRFPPTARTTDRRGRGGRALRGDDGPERVRHLALPRAGGRRAAEGPGFRRPATRGDPPERRHALAGARRAAGDPGRVKRLQLDRVRGGLVDKHVAIGKAFAYGRLLRDAWLAWPARVGPELAAQFDRDATAMGRARGVRTRAP